MTTVLPSTENVASPAFSLTVREFPVTAETTPVAVIAFGFAAASPFARLGRRRWRRHRRDRAHGVGMHPALVIHDFDGLTGFQHLGDPGTRLSCRLGLMASSCWRPSRPQSSWCRR